MICFVKMFLNYSYDSECRISKSKVILGHQLQSYGGRMYNKKVCRITLNSCQYSHQLHFIIFANSQRFITIFSSTKGLLKSIKDPCSQQVYQQTIFVLNRYHPHSNIGTSCPQFIFYKSFANLHQGMVVPSIYR